MAQFTKVTFWKIYEMVLERKPFQQGNITLGNSIAEFVKAKASISSIISAINPLRLVHNGGDIYEGNFVSGHASGFGSQIFLDGRYYTGQFLSNKLDGQGQFTWLDGRQYIGEYVKNRKQGYGEYRWQDGRVWKGEWTDGRMSGVGRFEMKGHLLQGEWKDGKYLT
jgi:hypothetical protein